MRKFVIAGLVVAGVATATVLGGVFGPAPRVPARPPALPIAVDQLERRIASTQDRLRRVPGDWSAWAGLGLAYLEHARITADPTYYPKADAAVARSFAIRPQANTDALVARGALENARHDFAAARRDAQDAVVTNTYHADAYAVLADAQTQLGDAAAASAADALAEARAEWSRRQHPDVADTLAWALHLSGQDTQALPYAQRALASGTVAASYLYHLGMIQIALGDRAAASSLSRALAINPAFSPIDAPIARTALAGVMAS